MYRDTRDTKVKMKQQTLAMAADQGDGYEQYRKLTKRDTFLLSIIGLAAQATRRRSQLSSNVRHQRQHHGPRSISSQPP